MFPASPAGAGECARNSSPSCGRSRSTWRRCRTWRGRPGRHPVRTAAGSQPLRQALRQDLVQAAAGTAAGGKGEFVADVVRCRLRDGVRGFVLARQLLGAGAGRECRVAGELSRWCKLAMELAGDQGLRPWARGAVRPVRGRRRRFADRDSVRCPPAKPSHFRLPVGRAQASHVGLDGGAGFLAVQEPGERRVLPVPHPRPGDLAPVLCLVSAT